MDEELSIINTNTRNEKIRNFFVNNKKSILIILSVTVCILIGYFVYAEYRENQKLKISDQYNFILTEYSDDSKEKTQNSLLELIYKNDPTYSPLSLYFIIDNKLINEKEKINDLFNVLINKTSLDKEIKNLIVYKKALYNADTIDENELLKILNPLINSKTVWKTHALYLIAEYYYSKNEKIKSKEFFNKILISENANKDIMKEAQKRLNRDLSE